VNRIFDIIAARQRAWSIAARLRLAFTVLLLLMLCMAAVGAWRLSQLSQVTHQMATTNLRMERLVGEWLALTNANIVRATALTHSADDRDLQRVLGPDMAAASERINQLSGQVRGLAGDTVGRALFQEVLDRRELYVGVRREILDKRKAGQLDAAKAAMDTAMLPASRAYLQSVQAMSDHYAREVAHDAEAATHSADTGRNLLLLMAVAGLLLGALSGWAIMRSITGPIRDAVSTARRVANGDLSTDIDVSRTDEMGQLLRALSEMTGRLRAMIGEVVEGARVVADTSSQIAAGNQDLSCRTEEQASTLEETASSMEELTSTVAQNADNARQASELASRASGVASRGGQVMTQMVDTMSGISRSSGRIAEITSLIDGIAFQTNILALNAAVEAARAGEQGRGFAVVAGEVRVLARRSATAAREIKSLIDESADQVTHGSKLVAEAGRTMAEIVEAARHVSDLVSEIAAASREQSTGIGQVNTAMSQMEQVVQQNASLVEEAAAAAESMKAQADTLFECMSRFTLPTAPLAAQVDARMAQRPESSSGRQEPAGRLAFQGR
jgi:methyl-accepting chemotaxis protein